MADMEKIAAELAAYAVTGEQPSHVKQAAFNLDALKQHLSNPYVYGSLAGMGAGGLYGLATGGDEEETGESRGSRALHYGLMGGLGGLGLAAGADMLGKANAPAPKEMQTPVRKGWGTVPRMAAGAGGVAVASGITHGALLGADWARRGVSKRLSPGVLKGLVRSRSLVRRMPWPVRLAIPAAAAIGGYAMSGPGE